MEITKIKYSHKKKNEIKAIIETFLNDCFENKKDFLPVLDKLFNNQTICSPKSATNYNNINKDIGLIVYNGIDTNKFNPENYEYNKDKLIKKEIGIDVNEKVILMVARVEKEKNHQSAIESLSVLHSKWEKKCHLLIVGGGSDAYIDKLKVMASEKKMNKYVHFIGNSNDVRRYYSIADVFTLTSSSETFSLAALEAMSFGLPCALTDVGGANEMIEENINGKLMRVNDIESISNTWYDVLNNGYNKNIIRNYVINNFDIKKMLDTYINILK